jgi:2-dehydro-3-deoxyphosphogluconate aldolase/(4S)-4-hydroxy-2-oxoglutarate aldolase
MPRLPHPIDTIARFRILPIVELPSVESAERLGEALIAGGLPLVEITLRTEAALASIERLANSVPSLLVGAGTVLTPEQARQAVDAGARFLVAPGLNTSVTRQATALGIPMVPGVATPTEIEAAMAESLGVVKLFPAGALGGPAYIAAIAAPYRGLRFIPTGGIGPDTVADYLALPSVIAVGGTWIARADALAAGDWAGIGARIADAVRLTANALDDREFAAIATDRA